jgi:hypothetical protein
MGTQATKRFRQNGMAIEKFLGKPQILFSTGRFITPSVQHDRAQDVGQLIVKSGNLLV